MRTRQRFIIYSNGERKYIDYINKQNTLATHILATGSSRQALLRFRDKGLYITSDIFMRALQENPLFNDPLIT